MRKKTDSEILLERIEILETQIAILLDRQAKFESKCREFEKTRFQPEITNIKLRLSSLERITL